MKLVRVLFADSTVMVVTYRMQDDRKAGLFVVVFSLGRIMKVCHAQRFNKDWVHCLQYIKQVDMVGFSVLQPYNQQFSGQS
jgi:hypothetical protein